MANTDYYDRFEDHKQQPKPEKEQRASVGETAYSLAKIFGYMFGGLLITAAVAAGLGVMFRYLLGIDYNNGVDANMQSTAAIVLIVLMIASFIGIIVMSFVVPITAAKENHSALVPAIIYSILMGVMLSTITVFIPWFLLGITFGITSAVFGLMALIAFLSKGRLNGLAIAAIGLLIGAAILSGVLLLLMLFGAIGGSMVWLYWVISLAVFAAVMLITIWDLARIKKIAEQGKLTNNLSLYCAYILYNDFINIFLRILRIVLYIFAKKN